MRLPVSPYFPTRMTKTLAEVSARGSSPVVTETWYVVTEDRVKHVRDARGECDLERHGRTGEGRDVGSDGRQLDDHLASLVAVLSDPVAVLEVELLLAVDVLHLHLAQQPVGVATSRVDVESDLEKLTNVTSRHLPHKHTYTYMYEQTNNLPSASTYPENVDSARQEPFADDVTVVLALVLERKFFRGATCSDEDDRDGRVGVAAVVRARVRPHHPLPARLARAIATQDRALFFRKRCRQLRAGSRDLSCFFRIDPAVVQEQVFGEGSLALLHDELLQKPGHIYNSSKT